MKGSAHKASAVEAIKAEAMAWFLRRDVSVLSPPEADAFAAWLDQSPEHRETYAAVEAFWSATAQLERHPGFEATRRWAIATVDRTRMTRRALAAGFAAVALGLGGVAFYLNTGPKPLADQAFRTAVGQQATVTLPDGSVLTLNTDTVVRTKADEDRRLVYLDRGQAFFRVAGDPRRPFVVTAAGRTVTAIGTAFDVRVDRGALKVVLVEGKVRVESAKVAPSQGQPRSALASATIPAAPMTTDMSAGSQLVAPDDADWRLTRTDVARETSWLQGQLVFDDEPLGEIVAELNRYSNRKIVLADARLATRRLSGNFTPGDVHGFSRALRAAGVADVTEEPNGELQIIAQR
jgi:transmembrane sensor